MIVPNNTLLGPDTYNWLFTMHGTTMIFLVAMPVLFGIMNYILPLQLGARDMAFPRLNALGVWLVPFGGILLHFSFLAGGAPAVGWFAYTPLSEAPYSSQLGVDYWAISLLVLGIGSVSAGINFIVTVLTQRAPGMTLRRLPLFSWMVFMNAFLVILALPILNAGLVMLLIDRLLGGRFFLPFGGGSAIMWQHIFWAFGHPEVYIVAIPAFAILSEVIPVFSRKAIFGHEFVAASTVIIVILSMLVWAHHMFTVGLGHAVDLFFVAASVLIAVPTGVKLFNWSATMVGGRVRFTTPMLFCVAALLQFLIGGLTGVSHAVAPLDWQTKNSYYLVAHFHNIFVGLIVFAILGGIHYWFPKMSGRMMSERIGKWTFWLMTIGFNLTFMIQHVLGLAGMPRRTFTYPDLPGWTWMNMVSTIGAFFMAAGSILFVWNLVISLFRGPPAGDNPWNAWTLEWATTSPHPDRPDPVVPVGGAIDTFRPDKIKAGVLTFIISEAGFFGVLILAYLFYNATSQSGPGAQQLDVLKTTIFSICLFASSFTIWRSEAGLRANKLGKMKAWLMATIVLGGIFIVGQGLEYWSLFQSGVTVGLDLFATTFFTLTGFHGLHVSFGLLALLVVLGVALVSNLKNGRFPALGAVGYYWHFVDVVWVFVFSIVYLWPLIR